MTDQNPDATFEPPLAGRTDVDPPSAPDAAGAAEPRAARTSRSLLRRAGLPIALVAAGLVGGAALTGVAVAANGGDTSSGIGSSTHGSVPALTLPDQDGAGATGPGDGGFTLPDRDGDQDHGRGPGSSSDSDGGSALAAPGSHTSTGASA